MKFIIPKEEKKSGVIKYVAIGIGIVLAIAGIFMLLKKLAKKNRVCECNCCCDDDCCDEECCCDGKEDTECCECEEDGECCECECGETAENTEDLF